MIRVYWKQNNMQFSRDQYNEPQVHGLKCSTREFSGSPVVRTHQSHSRVWGPSLVGEMLTQCTKKKKKKAGSGETTAADCCFCCSKQYSLWPHGLQHIRLLCPPLSSGVCTNSCPLSQWCHPTISSSVTPFSSCSVLPSWVSSSHQVAKRSELQHQPFQ